MTTLLIATRNAHKTAEFQAILGTGFRVVDLNSQPAMREIVEDGRTFEDNATIKALQVSRRCEAVVLSDDSGLEVDALGGAPGVHSASYAGPGATDALNRARLIDELRQADLDGTGTPARFRCVLVLAAMGDVLGSSSGTVEGMIIGEERGHGGFGYDPLFIPQGYDQTFGELPAEVKNTLSHRARAVAALRPLLSRL